MKGNMVRGPGSVAWGRWLWRDKRQPHRGKHEHCRPYKSYRYRRVLEELLTMRGGTHMYRTIHIKLKTMDCAL